MSNKTFDGWPEDDARRALAILLRIASLTPKMDDASILSKLELGMADSEGGTETIQSVLAGQIHVLQEHLGYTSELIIMLCELKTMADSNLSAAG